MTSLDFAKRHPTLLAVGMYDGTTAIYDTAREGEVSLLGVLGEVQRYGRGDGKSGGFVRYKHRDTVSNLAWQGDTSTDGC